MKVFIVKLRLIHSNVNIITSAVAVIRATVFLYVKRMHSEHVTVCKRLSLYVHVRPLLGDRYVCLKKMEVREMGEISQGDYLH